MATYADFGYPIIAPEQPRYLQFSNPTAARIDASGEKFGMIFQAYKSANIAYVTIRVGAASNAQTLKVSVQGVDASGYPNETISGATNSASGTCTGTVGDKRVTLGEVAAVTKNNFFAVVVEFDSTVGNVTMSAITMDGGMYIPVVPYCALKASTGPAWSMSTGNIPNCIVEFDDATYNTWPQAAFVSATSFSGDAIATNATYDATGNVIQFPFACRAVGAGFMGARVAGADFYLRLFDSSGTQLATSALIDGDAGGNVSYFGRYEALFTTAYALTANTAYKVAVVANTTTQRTLLAASQFSTGRAADMGMLPLGANCYYTRRQQSNGTWTTNDLARLGVYLLIEVDNTAGSSGGGGSYGY